MECHILSSLFCQMWSSLVFSNEINGARLKVREECFSFLDFSFKYLDQLLFLSSSVELQPLQNWWMPYRCSSYASVMSCSLNDTLSMYLCIYFDYVHVCLLLFYCKVEFQMWIVWILKSNNIMQQITERLCRCILSFFSYCQEITSLVINVLSCNTNNKHCGFKHNQLVK